MGVGILPTRPRSPGLQRCREFSTLKFLQTQAPADHSAHYDFALDAGNQWFKFSTPRVDLSFLLNRMTILGVCKPIHPTSVTIPGNRVKAVFRSCSYSVRTCASQSHEVGNQCTRKPRRLEVFWDKVRDRAFPSR